MPEWEFIMPMIVSVTFIIAAAGVIILRPLTKRLGHVLEQMHRDRQSRVEHAEVVRIAALVERLDDRMARLEERQEFMERLLESGGTIRSATAPGSEDLRT